MAKRWIKSIRSDRFFSWAPKSLWTMTSAMKFPCKKSNDKPRQHIKMRGITFPAKVHTVKASVFPVVMYRCESRTIKKAEREEVMISTCGSGILLRFPWTARRSNQSILKEIYPKSFRRADAEAPILWPPDVKSRLTGKDTDARKD